MELGIALRWIRDKPKRRLLLLAGAALLVALALGGLKYALDLARERTAAVAAREEAVRRRGQAEDLIGFMLGDLRKKVEPLAGRTGSSSSRTRTSSSIRGRPHFFISTASTKRRSSCRDWRPADTAIPPS